MPKIPSHLTHHNHQFAFQFISFILITIVFGCTSHRYTGAPEPSYDVDEDLRQLAEKFQPATAISDYYKTRTPTPNDRNAVISARLVMVNLEYLKWLRTVTADKQLLDTATDVLVISLNLAATAIGVETAKTVLSAISAGVLGSKASVDKHYYFEKTLPALVAAMNAQRKTVLVRILEGMNRSLDEYPFEQALAEVYEYYEAGTFMGAIIAIEAESGAKEKEADKKIVLITKPTPGEKECVKKLQAEWVKLYEGKTTGEIPNAVTLPKALQSLGEDTPSAINDVLDRLHGLLNQRKKTCVEIQKALKDAGYPGL